MGRPTREQAEEKKRLLQQEQGEGSATVDNTNQSQEIADKTAAAEEKAGLLPVDLPVTQDPLEVEAEKQGAAANQEANAEKVGEGSDEENTAIQAQQEGSQNELSSQDTAGNSSNSEEEIGNRPAPKDEDEHKFVTQEDLDTYPGISASGIQIGDPMNEETFKKYSDYMELNPHLYPKDHPQYKPMKLTLADVLDAGVVLTDAEIEGLKFTGILENETGDVLNEEKLNDFLQERLRAAQDQEEQKGNDYPGDVYHGDYLTEEQLNEPNVTYDWDEVTAPDHLAQRPYVAQPFTDGKKEHN